MEFNNVIEKRASVRTFSYKKPGTEEIIELIEAANLSPTPGNLPILKYIVIEDKEKISTIAQACQQKFIAEAPIVIIICSNKKDCEMMYDTRADKYIKQHTGAAIENLLLKATDIGLASCWVGAFVESTIKDMLAIPDNIEIEAILPVGYDTKNTKQKRKPSLDKRLYFEMWKNKFKLPPSKIRRDDV
jgi:nitroreductase